MLGIDILVHLASEGCCHHLYASTNAQDGDLPMKGFLGKEEFLIVAFGADAVELWYGFFAQEERIDVAST